MTSLVNIVFSHVKTENQTKVEENIYKPILQSQL